MSTFQRILGKFQDEVRVFGERYEESCVSILGDIDEKWHGAACRTLKLASMVGVLPQDDYDALSAVLGESVEAFHEQDIPHKMTTFTGISAIAEVLHEALDDRLRG